MKLISRIALRLSLALLPLMALWGVLFYFTMVDEINDEADDALEDYSELIVKRMLAGRELPKPNNGSNNSYSIVPIGAPEAAVRPHIDYYDAEVYIPEKEETEPARVLTTIFQDADGAYYELKVATPTFEKDDLLRAILYWVVFLYLLLLLTTISLTVWVFHRSMRPLQCRFFPLAPHLNLDDELELILSPLELPYSCPLIRDKMKLNDSFIKATYTVWKHLIRDPLIYDLVRMDSDDRIYGRVPLTIVKKAE